MPKSSSWQSETGSYVQRSKSGWSQDMCKKRFVYVKELKVLVLDEADVMLDQELAVLCLLIYLHEETT